MKGDNKIEGLLWKFLNKLAMINFSKKRFKIFVAFISVILFVSPDFSFAQLSKNDMRLYKRVLKQAEENFRIEEYEEARAKNLDHI